MTTDQDRRNVATDAVKSNDMRTADLANGENPDDSTSRALSDNAERGTAAGDADRVEGRRSFHEGRRPHETPDLEGEDLA